MNLWVNKFLLRTAFSMKACWHCHVSSLHLTSCPFYFSIHTLSHKANTASVHQVSVCIHCSHPSALHTDTSLWLPHSCAWRTSGSDNPGAIPQLPIPLSYEPCPTPSTEMLNGISYPPASCSTFFSHYSRLQHVFSGFSLLTNSFTATLRVWLRFAASGEDTHFDESLEGILQTL